MERVSVQIVTFESAGDIGPCLDSLRDQTFTRFRVRLLDNHSSDRTRDAIWEAIERTGLGIDLLLSGTNTGFAAAHNRLATRFPAEYLLFLNPDTIAAPDFIEQLVRALDSDPRAGSATGKLMRMDGETIDSTGIVMTRNQRHLDRGADEPDRGQWNEAGEVFGASGAAAMYRRACLEDVAVDGMYFDEDFFAYREDADLAWRCRLMDWTCLYVPTAILRHRRRVTPERRSALPAVINRHSAKNRFLLRINNLTPGVRRALRWPIASRDAAVVGYVILREWSSIPGLWFLLRHRQRLLKKGRKIRSRARASDAAILRWFV
jgi:GT2 family glycosyltransferase